MKIVIETLPNDIGSIEFFDDDQVQAWENMERSEQLKCLNAMAAYSNLYSKFLKTE
jgi:hypothetical protein